MLIPLSDVGASWSLRSSSHCSCVSWTFELLLLREEDFACSLLGTCLDEHGCSGEGRVLGDGEVMGGLGAGAAERVCVGCLLPMVGEAVEQGAATVVRDVEGLLQ